MLQDVGLIFHPPLLYMGYVGFSVAFAFAIASLMTGKLDSAWARWSRPWTLAAWVFLTLGIVLGSWWAYYELGWGGWWFWDPVENSSFMPWLAGTALIHSLSVTEKTWFFQSLDGITCDFSLFALFTRHVLSSFWHLSFSSRICIGSNSWFVYFGLPCCSNWWFACALCV